jgi:hypothetical protein
MKLKPIRNLMLFAALAFSFSLCFAQHDMGRHHEDMNERHYRHHEDNGLTYMGRYEHHGDIFIFENRDGKEFDLYIQPMRRPPRWFRGYPIETGNSYDINIRETKMYPGADEVHAGVSLNFEWGNLTLENGRYYRMYTTSDLVNIRGRLYMRGHDRYEIRD